MKSFLLLVLFTGIHLSYGDIASETGQTQDDIAQMQAKIQQLSQIQQKIFGVKSTTREDTAIAQDSKFKIVFPFMAADAPSSSPEQLPYLFEGDIVLSNELANEILRNANDMLNNKTDNKAKRSVTINLNLRWSNLPIPYYIDLETGVAEQAVLKGIDRWQQETCLSFSRLPTMPDKTMNALIFIRGSGCYSFIGKNGNRPQQVSIGTGCESLGTVTHEIGHALGLYHEQSRYDRNNYVDIIVQNIQSAYLGQFSRQGTNMMLDYGVGYDYGSVMHYDQSSFNKRGRRTIETLDNDYQQTIGQRAKPSFADVKRINFAYCNATCPSQLNCLNGGYTDPKNCAVCRCPDGLGGTFCDQVQTSDSACGQTSFTTTNDFQIVKMAGEITCNYMVNAPIGMTIFFELGNMTFAAHNPCASEYLEVKYRSNFVQAGARYCKKYPTNTLSESETMLFIYKGSPTSAVNIRFRTGPSISSIGSNNNWGTNIDDYYGHYDERPPKQVFCSNWSPCTAPCGACGQSTRYCNGVPQTIPCNVLPCPNNYCCPPAYNNKNLCVFSGPSKFDNNYPDYYYN